MFNVFFNKHLRLFAYGPMMGLMCDLVNCEFSVLFLLRSFYLHYRVHCKRYLLSSFRGKHTFIFMCKWYTFFEVKSNYVPLRDWSLSHIVSKVINFQTTVFAMGPYSSKPGSTILEHRSIYLPVRKTKPRPFWVKPCLYLSTWIISFYPCHHWRRYFY